MEIRENIWARGKRTGRKEKMEENEKLESIGERRKERRDGRDAQIGV